MQFSTQTIDELKAIVENAVATGSKGVPATTVVVVDRTGAEQFAYSAGKKGISSKEAMTLDNVFWIASCTKMIVGIACMQLVEKGLLKLDDSHQLEKLCPELADIKVLDAEGKLVDKVRGITLRMLLTHTAGFGYTFFNTRLRDWSLPAGVDEFSGSIRDMVQPLLFQPGEGWEYGIGIDWAGIALERVTNTSLNEYIQTNICQPLGLQNVNMFPTPQMKAQLAYMHQKRPDGKVVTRDHILHRPLIVQSEEEIRGCFNSGGAGMFAKPQEYTRILSVLLNDGTCPITKAQILKKETVDEMFTNQISKFPNFATQGLQDAKPDLSNYLPGLYPVPENIPQDWQNTVGSCSNCTKTRKQCTFNWARSQQVQIRERRQASENTTLPDRKRLKSGDETESPLAGEQSKSHIGGFQPVASGSNLNYLDAELPGIPTFPSMDSQLSPNFFSSCPSALSFDSSPSVFPSSSASVSGFSDVFDLDQAESSSPNATSISGLSPVANVDMVKKTRKRSWRSQRSPTSAYSGPSDFALAQRLVVRTNSGLMTDNLMRLYHDVMEGALSCWLTEQNCPYLPLAKPARLPSLTDAPSQGSISAPSNLPNRIYQRVVKLDKSLASLGIRPLSSVEDKKATKALHLAIMAFTAQWAQGSQRSQERYEQRRMFGEDLFASGFGEDFDTTLQVSFWNQARRCLDDCAGIGSFKVALAELIFGLAQKHTDESEWDEHDLDPLGPGQNEEPAGEGSFTANRVKKILDEDGHPMYLERAARRLHVLKSRCEAFERKKKKPEENQAAGEDENAEDKATMKMVYWMAIMFDTLSAAIAERPPTISDEDSKESNMQLAVTGSSEYFSSVLDERWNDRYIIKRDQNLAPLRLPCSEEAISKELIDAAPVKVLLFRKITRMQSLFSRGASQSAIEDAIQEGLAVHRYWDMTYRPMFEDCLQNHKTLLPKIQSWYVPLLGHWLLAVMIMADCIKLLDDQHMSVPLRAAERAQAGVVGHLRRSGMWAVSDLARVSTPRDDDMGRLASYHPAVNEGALLTEPWTMVLTRSFATAGKLFLNDAAEAGKLTLPGDGSRLDLLGRCEECVKALWYLGRKSSISRQVAGILGAGLDAERSKTFNLGAGVAAYEPLAPFDSVGGF
ncbi:hypothetical protein LY78DRAFT_693297 [Colletotrichum sublineola]|nr:hypothetical protein LY78DRAFT_693297 [Colletotrichum sublineola]